MSGPATATTPLTNSYSYAYNPLGWTTIMTTLVSGALTSTVITHDVLGRVTQTAGPPGEQWVARSSGISTGLKGVACPSLALCYAVGDGGIIRASGDGGATWSGQTSGTTNNLTAISCPSTSVCFAVGSSGTILTTTNGGSTWSSQASGTTHSLYGVSCPSASICFAVGFGGTIVGTTNGGTTWSGQTSGTSNNLNAISCPSTSVCFAVGVGPTIVATFNGGSTWVGQSSATSFELRGIACPATTVCTAVGITGTIETTNGGGSWTAELSGTTHYFAGIACPSTTQCLVDGGSGDIRGTTNGGTLWTAQNSSTSNYLRAAACADTSSCVVVGDSGTILTSSGRALYVYDGNGNVLTSSTYGLTTTYGFSAAIIPNEVLTLTVPGQVPVYYGYDQNGDTAAITTTDLSTNTHLSYDSQARPITVTLTDGTLITQTYNTAGQRAAYVVSKSGMTSLSQSFTYRGDELGQVVTLSSGQTYTDTYLYNANGAPLELLRQYAGQALQRYWYEEDGRGNVVALTDITGTVVDRYYYDVWGHLIGGSEGVPQRLRYGGYWYDAELGWFWVSVRQYDPALKRWLQPDPSQQDGVRTYVYVGDDPADAADPTGLGQCSLWPGDWGTCWNQFWSNAHASAKAYVQTHRDVYQGPGYALARRTQQGLYSFALSEAGWFDANSHGNFSRLVDLLPGPSVDRSSRTYLNGYCDNKCDYYYGIGSVRSSVTSVSPGSFGLSTMAEDPRLLRMCNNAMRSAATSRRANGYTRYLEALEAGQSPSQSMLESAFDTVRRRFLVSARDEGYDIAEVHHWNFPKTDFPTQIVDPRNLVPMSSRDLHQDVHTAASGTTDIWSGSTAPDSQVSISDWSIPLDF